MECKLIGAEIVSRIGGKGIIVDKVFKSCNQSSITAYICMNEIGGIFTIDYDDIKEIIRFVTSPNSDFAIYLEQYKNSK